MDLFDIIAGRQGSGGGSSGVTDQSYNPKSQNAQSGLAVAEAIGKVDQTAKLLNFPIDSIFSASREKNQGYISLHYMIKLETIDNIDTETGVVTTTPLRTNIPDIKTIYTGVLEREILGEIKNIILKLDMTEIDPDVSPAIQDTPETQIKLVVEEAGALYSRTVNIDHITSSWNMLIIDIKASSTDSEVLNALDDEFFSTILAAQKNIILEYKREPVLEEFISEVIE